MVTRQEIVEKVTGLVNRVYGGDWSKAFKVLDKDQNGLIGQSDLTNILSLCNIGYMATRWGIAGAIINAMDSNGDGEISFEEFQSMAHAGRTTMATMELPIPNSYEPAEDPANESIGLVTAVPRSSHWPAVRKAHLEKEPECVACGSKTALEVHHIIPFHEDMAKELDPMNLITLCECPAHNCHLIFGHLLNWKLSNPDVAKDAVIYREKMKKARGQS